MLSAGWMTRSDVFAGCSTDDAAHLGTVMTLRSAPAGMRLLRFGDPVDELLVVLEGHVSLCYPLPAYGAVRELRVLSVGPGHALGWSAVVAPHRSTLSAHAEGPCELAVFAREALDRLLRSRPELALRVTQNLAQIISERLVETQELWARAAQRTLVSSSRLHPNIELVNEPA